MFLNVSIPNFKEMNLRSTVCSINLTHGFFKEELLPPNLGPLHRMF